MLWEGGCGVARLGRGTEDLEGCQRWQGSGQTMGAHREDDGDTSSHRLATVQGGLLAQPQVLRLAAMALPAGNGGAIQEHLYALAGG